jgi:hypothetical protein
MLLGRLRYSTGLGTIEVCEYIASRLEGSNMITDEIKQVVKSRYGKFAETGSRKESC